MALIIGVEVCALEILGQVAIKNLDLEGVAGGCVGGMLRATIPARASREGAEQVDFCQKINVIAGANGAGFHEILARVAGEACAHEDIEHVMDMRLGLREGEPRFIGQRTR